MSLAKLPSLLFLVGAVVWTILFAAIFLGILWTIADAARHAWTGTPASGLFGLFTTGEPGLRGTLITLTAMTASLGAIVALPLTLIRLQLTQQQTKTAVESLFNDKINAASTDLAARKEVTRVVGTGDHERILTEQTDDLVTRAAAIDRLEGLVEERPDAAPRVARLLSVYVRELSAEYPPKPVPENADPRAIRAWAESLKPIRSDMEKAVQTLGRLQKIRSVNPDDVKIDLRGSNLQGFDLIGLTFERARFDGANLQKAQLERAQLQGSIFVGAELQGASLYKTKLKGADLGDARLDGANLFQVELDNAKLSWAKVRGAYLHGAQLKGATLDNADLKGAKLSDANLNMANLSDANLESADLSGAELLNVNFQWANLLRAKLNKGNLQGSDLSDTILDGVELTYCKLQNSNLSGIKMNGAKLSGTELQGAKVIDAELRGAQIIRVKFDGTTDFYGNSIQGAAIRMICYETTLHFLPYLDQVFADSSVPLPADTPWPAHWGNQRGDPPLDWDDFNQKWRAWQAEFHPDTLPEGDTP